jgi:hypothetical protein
MIVVLSLEKHHDKMIPSSEGLNILCGLVDIARSHRS